MEIELKQKTIMTYSNNFCYIDSDKFEPLYYSTELTEDKDTLRFIKKVETVIRTSEEYKRFIRYLKDELKLTNCSIFMGVSSSTDIKLEMHHSPFTLFDIVDIVIRSRESNGIPLSTFSVAEEVMLLHYQGVVGVIQLTSTAHQMVHEGLLSVNSNEIIGNIKGFHELFSTQFNDAQTTKYENYVKNFNLTNHKETRESEIAKLFNKPDAITDKDVLNEILEGKSINEN